MFSIFEIVAEKPKAEANFFFWRLAGKLLLDSVVASHWSFATGANWSASCQRSRNGSTKGAVVDTGREAE